MSKPSVFVGSSSEGLDVASALQGLLEPIAEVTIWNQGIFGLVDSTLEMLVEQSRKYDFGIVVLGPDDRVNMRGAEKSAPRDNAIFELGLFMGSIGRNRTMMVVSDTFDLRLPTDLAGITTARYSSKRADGNLAAALGPAANQIRLNINSLGGRHSNELYRKLTKSELWVKRGDLLDYAKEENTILFPANVYFDTSSISKIVEEKSTLGKWLARFQSTEAREEFDSALDAEITRSRLKKDKGQKDLPSKPGRQTPFVPGSTVHLNSTQGLVIFTSLTRVDAPGTNYRVTIDEELLFLALRNLWKSIGVCPARGDLYMPVISSGYGGITHAAALAHILLSYKAAEAEAKLRICDSLQIIVYHRDWSDGNWVRNIFDGLLQ